MGHLNKSSSNNVTSMLVLRKYYRNLVTSIYEVYMKIQQVYQHLRTILTCLALDTYISIRT